MSFWVENELLYIFPILPRVAAKLKTKWKDCHEWVKFNWRDTRSYGLYVKAYVKFDNDVRTCYTIQCEFNQKRVKLSNLGSETSWSFVENFDIHLIYLNENFNTFSHKKWRV